VQRLAQHVAADGVTTASLSHEYWIEMHYVGQASAFAVKIPAADVDTATLRKLFLAQYEERYGHASESRAIAIDGARVVATAKGRRPDYARLDRGNGETKLAQKRRSVWFGGERTDCPVFERSSLKADFSAEGPAIIEEDGSTTVVPPGWAVTVDSLRSLRLNAFKR
jgi:N-methylhydantoinase A